jgi:hypothetical protein
LKRASLIVVAGVAACVASGCSVPFAPGYTIERQKIEVTYSKASADRVSVRAWYQMRNTGTQPLDEIRFRLPYKNWTENLRVEWGGQTLPSQDVAGSEVEFSPHLNTPWNLKERKELALSFDLKIVNTKVSLGENRGSFFFLPSGGWYPYLLPPPGTLAQGGAPPAKWDLVVSVPAAYLVHASGTQRGKDHSGSRDSGGTTHRFEQKLATDFDPFVVAGPYAEQQAHTGSETVFLWSAKALVDSHAKEIGDRFGEEAAYFTSEFGLKDVTKGQAWIIECPAGSTIEHDQPDQFSNASQGESWSAIVDCLAVPQGVFIPNSLEKADLPGSFVVPSNADASKILAPFPSMDVQLAATWFTFTLGGTPDGPIFPMSATPNYMALAFAISKNPSSRGDLVRQLIQGVDSDPAGAKETLESAKSTEIARIRSELFYLALEDRCGAANVHHALARILRILRGKTWSVSDLRSAMEAECGADLADFFRQWLLRPGIPDEFRARYASASAAKPSGEMN